MTLISIITQALTTMGRSTDAQSMETWKEKLTIFANDGAKDVAEFLQLRQTETIAAEDQQIDINDLSNTCIKVCKVRVGSEELDFTQGTDSTHINVGVDGDVTVEYRYLPPDMSEDIDEPGIPAHLHRLLVPYVVYREHMTADPTMQRRADLFWQTYWQGLMSARKDNGEINTYRFKNTRWF